MYAALHALPDPGRPCQCSGKRAQENGTSSGWQLLLWGLVVLLGMGVPSSCQAREDDGDLRERILAQLGVPNWHHRGVRGRGIKVAVLDSGFRGYRDHLGKALPKRVTVRSFRFDGDLEARNSEHGILCAEVIHTLAPEAELLFANWQPQHPEQYLKAVRWARQQGAQIISCSVIMPSWSDGEGGGPTHAAIARALGTGDRPEDALFFAAAGNTAHRHWAGTFRGDRDGWLLWDGKQIDNPLLPWGTKRVSVELCVPFPANPNKLDRDKGTKRKACPRYEVVIREAKSERVVVRAQSPRSPWKEGRSCAVASFRPRARKRYVVRIRCLTEGLPEKPGTFHVTVLGGGMVHHRKWGSVPFPGDGQRTLAVGAVTLEGRRYSYSACGSDRAGTHKPEFVAPVPFPSSWRRRPFSGTSAAAPQGAGIAALVWSLHPQWTANQVRLTMVSAACTPGGKAEEPSADKREPSKRLPLDPTSPPEAPLREHHLEMGYGLLHLP